jgi:hypothetical protein
VIAFLRITHIKRLQTAPAGIAVAELANHIRHDVLNLGDRSAQHQRPRLFQRLANAFAARNFANAGVAAAVFEDDDVARKQRPVGATQAQCPN